MRKLGLCCVVFVAFFVGNVFAGGMPGQEMPDFQRKSGSVDPSIKEMLEDMQKKLDNTISELQKTKDDLKKTKSELAGLKNAVAQSNQGSGLEALPVGYDAPFQVLPPRRTEGQFFTFGELVYAKPRGFGFAVAVDRNAGGLPDGELEMLNYDYELSYRVGGGYKFANDMGTLSATYWHHDSDKRKTFDSGLTMDVIAQGNYPELSTLNFPATSGRATSSIRFDVLDIDYTKPFRVARNLDVSFGLGARIVQTDQETRCTFGAANGDRLSISVPYDVTLAGPRAISEARLYLPFDLEAFGMISGSLLLGHFDTSYDLATTDGNSTSNMKIEDTMMIPNIDMRLGLSYTPKCFFDGNVRFSGGYEMVYYPGLMRGFYSGEHLSFDGMVSKVEVMF